MDERTADIGAITAAFATLQEGVAVVDRSGVVRAANPAAARILGVDGEAIPGHTLARRLGPTFFADGTAVTEENTKIAEVLRTGRAVTGVTLRFITPEGRERWLEVSYQPLRHIGEEEPWAVLSSFVDVTHRRTEQTTLARRERDFRLLAENSTDMITRTTPDAVYTYVSPASREILGYEPEEMVGQTVFHFAHPDDVAELDRTWKRLQTTGEVLVAESRRRRKGGDYVWVESRVRSIRDPDTGEVRETQSSVRDISAHRQMEDELRRSNAELQQFAAVASHDLAEPLATMGGFATLLRRRHAEALGPDGLEMLGRIASAAERMRRLIDDMLTLAQAGAEPARREPVPLTAVLEDVCSALGASIERTGARIEVAELPTVSGDRSQLTRLFQNLLANALKFTAPEKAPEIDVVAHPEGDDWCVEVADRGFGIEPEDAERAFEAFRRLHTEARTSGTGLGLAICRRIARAHGGDVRARPREGGGTVFAVLLLAGPESGA